MSEQFGYTGSILKVDLSSGRISSVPTENYAGRFVGGIGVGSKIYWDEVPVQAKAFDPENRLIVMTGPFAGIGGVAGARWVICGKSPGLNPEGFCHCNLGGKWGVQLKFAGYDGVVVHGKADRPVYLFIEDGTAEIRDASHLWGKGALEVREALKNELGNSTSVMATGPAGENMVPFANILADNDASGSSGFGAVMGSKILKGIAIRGSGRVNMADPERFRQLARHVRELKQGGQLPDIGIVAGPTMKKDPCYGCSGIGCYRATFTAANGKKGKFMCGSALFYQDLASRYYKEHNEVPFLANKLCDEYGLDINTLTPMLSWLLRCHAKGILTDAGTNIPFSKMGSLEFVETLIKTISLRQGFGDVLARGISPAAEFVGKGSQDLLVDFVMRDKLLPHDPRVYITTSILYATEPQPMPMQFGEVMEPLLHWLCWARKHQGAFLSSESFRGIARRFWGSELAVDFSTYDGKALAAKTMQDREYAKDNLILCSFSWPITIVRGSADHIGDPSLESKLLAAATGRETDEEQLYRVGERTFNLRRAILIREGHKGRASDDLPEYLHTRPIKRLLPAYNVDCLVPGKDGEPMYKTGAVVDKDKFEAIKGEYYQLRGWDVGTGIPTRKKLEELDLADVAVELGRSGLVS